MYGFETAADNIARANAGVSEPLTPGTDVVIPDLPDAPQNLPTQGAANNPDELALAIDGERFRFWDKLTITRTRDAMDAIVASSPFESNNPALRELFRPGKYRDLSVTIGGTRLFAGTLVQPLPALTPESNTVSLSGYARPGVLKDCPMPAAAYPLEFNNQNLKQIAVTLCAPFGVAVAFEGDVGAVFERVALKPGKKVLEFLIELAKQRNRIISSTPNGALYFPDTQVRNAPRANLVQGQSPLQSVTPQIDGENYYSHVTGIQPTAVGSKGGQYTVKNPHLTGVVRPFTFNLPDITGGDARAAVQAKAASMFGSAFSWSVDVATWRDSFGQLWEPGSEITMEAPGVFIFSRFTFEVRSAVLSAEGSERSATLELVIPGVFAGQIPEALPWDE